LTFFQPDFDKFPCLKLAYDVLRQGGTCPAVVNAANEVAVENFLAGRIRFTDIAELNEQVLFAHVSQPVTDLDVLLEADRWARDRARTALKRMQPRAVASA
jgi:1-deoxy-D-xylulose-5-phosphate reductoisomerase